jgi:hypothetical protein
MNERTSMDDFGIERKQWMGYRILEKKYSGSLSFV